MKESIKAKTIFTFFLGIIFIAVFSGCADIDHKSVETGISIKGKKEILVARDVGGGGTFYEIKWCGNNALLFKGTEIGIVLIDIEGGKRVTITSPSDYDWPLNCTPDGRWVVYVHEVSIPNPDYEEYDGPGENPYQPRLVVDEVYRYEVATGKREKFAATMSIGSSFDWVSPDGKKISLVPWHPSLMDFKRLYQSLRGAPEPWLKEAWFSNKKWSVVEHAWFPDSSGMAALLSYPSDVGVEFFGEDGRAESFDLWPDSGRWWSSLKVDKESRIYFKTSMDTIPDPDINTVLHRCTIKDRELACENILERDELGPYEILPGGDILFDDECIRRTSPGGTDAECVIGKRYGSRVYRGVGLSGISPDGRWLAFERADWISTPGELYSNYQIDLFVVELNKD